MPPRSMSLARSASYFALSVTRSISSEMSSNDWPYLIAPRGALARLNQRSSDSVLNGAAFPSEASHALKSRFMPYVKSVEQFALRPLRSSTPPHVFHSRKFRVVSAVTTLGMFAGSTMVAPSCLSAAIASLITAVCAALIPPRGMLVPGMVNAS